MKRPLVTGANGQLGRALRTVLPDALFLGSGELDVTDRATVDALPWGEVAAVVNAAAWTAVDAAEDPEHTLRAWAVNATAVAHLAWHARDRGVPLVHVSTDYVFGDVAERVPIPVDAPVGPVGAYGATKAAGEAAARLAPQHYVVRTSWVFGDGPNFVRTMRRLAAERSEVTVVDDQYGRPTYALDLAAALVALLERRCPPGVYHATGSGPVASWADVAAAAVEGTGCSVRRVTTEEYLRTAPNAAPRPAWSVLDLSRLEGEGIAMRDWRLALQDYLEAERQGPES